ncbi:MAG: methyltransferase domain-containing protein [candidate division WOR-3 bacterium]|nr:MAG: methyltransferase domain-containing protein [candidate division WOR-3 bacterium]
MLSGKQDAFGRWLLDHLRGADRGSATERDDGYINVTASADRYFSEPGDWPRQDREALKLVRGRVLDVGCGAGRHCLHLQGLGLDVTGIDNSELAVRVCRRRGVRRAVGASLTDALAMPLNRLGGRFDTVLMMGTNFGLFGRSRLLPARLRRLLRVATPQARIIGSTLDPYGSKAPRHVAYHRANRRRGRLGGEVRIRVLYGGYRTPWFDHLFVSRPELKRLLAGTGWRLARTIDGPGNRYIAVIERQG